MSQPASDIYKSWPGMLKAGEPKTIKIKTIGAIEVINLDRRGRIWVRFDGLEPEPMKPDNFVVFLSRRFTTNRGTVSVTLRAEQDTNVTIEGAIF